MMPIALSGQALTHALAQRIQQDEEQPHAARESQVVTQERARLVAAVAAQQPRRSDKRADGGNKEPAPRYGTALTRSLSGVMRDVRQGRTVRQNFRHFSISPGMQLEGCLSSSQRELSNRLEKKTAGSVKFRLSACQAFRADCCDE